jgi:hypothetical protein
MQADAHAGFARLYRPGRKPAQSSRQRAGHMRGATSSRSPGSTRRRLPSKRLSALMPCSRSSARSMASRNKNACGCAASKAARSSLHWTSGRANNAPSSPARARSPRPASLDGRHSRASSTMAGCACPRQGCLRVTLFGLVPATPQCTRRQINIWRFSGGSGETYRWLVDRSSSG